jgi:hypothetical protein
MWVVARREHGAACGGHGAQDRTGSRVRAWSQSTGATAPYQPRPRHRSPRPHPRPAPTPAPPRPAAPRQQRASSAPAARAHSLKPCLCTRMASRIVPATHWRCGTHAPTCRCMLRVLTASGTSGSSLWVLLCEVWVRRAHGVVFVRAEQQVGHARRLEQRAQCRPTCTQPPFLKQRHAHGVNQACASM